MTPHEHPSLPLELFLEQSPIKTLSSSAAPLFITQSRESFVAGLPHPLRTLIGIIASHFIHQLASLHS
jgi:hypothetical protein